MNIACLSVIWFVVSMMLHPLTFVYTNQEVDALKAFKDAVTNDPTGALNWDTSLGNPCSWVHITCDDLNNVISVYVIAFGLKGHLVSQLGSLSKLQHLNLVGNELTGTIPAELGDLSELISLELNNNSLTGPIPDTLGKLTKLNILYLQNNNLSGRIPVQALQPIAYNGSVDLSNNPLLCTPFTDPPC